MLLLYDSTIGYSKYPRKILYSVLNQDDINLQMVRIQSIMQNWGFDPNYTNGDLCYLDSGDDVGY